MNIDKHRYICEAYRALEYSCISCKCAVVLITETCHNEHKRRSFHVAKSQHACCKFVETGPW